MSFADYKGRQQVTTNIDFVADIEITGSQVTNRRYAPSSSGDNVLVAVGSGQRMKLFKAILTVSQDITGEIILKLGSTQIGGTRNPKSGGAYILISTFPDYELGGDGEDLILNLPSAVAVTLNASYEVA